MCSAWAESAGNNKPQVYEGRRWKQLRGPIIKELEESLSQESSKRTLIKKYIDLKTGLI